MREVVGATLIASSAPLRHWDRTANMSTLVLRVFVSQSDVLANAVQPQIVCSCVVSQRAKWLPTREAWAQPRRAPTMPKLSIAGLTFFDVVF